MTRIHLPAALAAGDETELPPGAARRIARVLRMRAGERVTAFDGAGREYAAVITRVDRRAVRIRVESVRPVDRESPLAVTLAQGVSRGERMDYTVQKAVELGVARVEPVLTGRGVVRLDRARGREKAAHWQAIAAGACEQCGRNRVPEVALPVAFGEWLARRREGPATPGLLLDPARGARLRELAAPAAGVTLLAGPEGGLTEAERDAALAAGCAAVRLGPRVLRTETAALAALAAMQALWGDG